MSQGILEDEGDEASDQQKKEDLKTRLENGGRQLDIHSGIIPNLVTSASSSILQSSQDDTLPYRTNLTTRTVFGSSQDERKGTRDDVDDHEYVQDISVRYSNFTPKPHDHESKEEDEGGGDYHNLSSNQFSGEIRQ